jgi:hypothetical protein
MSSRRRAVGIVRVASARSAIGTRSQIASRRPSCRERASRTYEREGVDLIDVFEVVSRVEAKGVGGSPPDIGEITGRTAAKCRWWYERTGQFVGEASLAPTSPT